MEFTLSVRSFHVPLTPLHLGLAAEVALRAHLAGDPGDLVGEADELVDHRVERVLQLEDLAADVDGDLLGEVALGDGGRDLGDVAHLVGEVVGEEVHVVREVLPRAADPGHLGLTAEASFDAHLACHAGDLAGEPGQLVDHRVEGVLQLEDLATRLDGDLLGQVAAWRRRS